jgi:hypothetical protein
VALGVFDVLNAITRPKQKLAQSCLAFDKRFAAHVVAIEHQQIKSDCDCIAIIETTMEQIELRRTFAVEADDLSVNNG